MGALIVSRHPRHPIGWLLCVASLLSVTLAAEAFSVWVLDGGGPGPASWGHLAAWAGPLLGWPAFTALVLVFLIAPDGHLATPRWRWVVRVTVAGLILHMAGTLTTPPGDFVYGQRDSSRAITAPLLTVGYLLIAAGLIASAVSLVVRLRRSKDDERRQLLWIASAAALLALGVVLILVVPRMTGVEGTWLAGLPLRLAQVAVPFCVAVAVLRHRLLDIDVIVNRAVLLALATAFVAGGYILVVVTVGLAVGVVGGFWPSLLATSVVALAFQPLRRRLVRVADRLAFGGAAAPYEALAEFSRRLGESPDPSTFLPAMAKAAAHAVNANRAVVVLRLDLGPDLTTVWTAEGVDRITTAAWEIPVLDHGERLGSITVFMPSGHPLRPREQRLLADLADQAGMAFRNDRLTAELPGQVAQISRRTGELSESRRRLISANDAERSRLEQAIAHQVILHLEPLPRRLHQLSDADRVTAPLMDAELLRASIESVNIAMEALREITRGVFPAQLARSGLADSPGVTSDPNSGRPATGGRRVRSRTTVRHEGRSRGVLLRRRGHARPQPSRPGRPRHSRRPAAAGGAWWRWRCASPGPHARPGRGSGRLDVSGVQRWTHPPGDCPSSTQDGRRLLTTSTEVDQDRGERSADGGPPATEEPVRSERRLRDVRRCS